MRIVTICYNSNRKWIQAQILIWVFISVQVKILDHFPLISSFTLGLFRRVLVSEYLGDFLEIIFLLIPILITLWSENILALNWILWNLLKPVYKATIWSILVHLPFALMHLLFDECFVSIRSNWLIVLLKSFIGWFLSTGSIIYVFLIMSWMSLLFEHVKCSYNCTY